MATTYFRFPTSKTIYRVVNHREFMGLDGMLCDAITEHGRPSIEVVLRNQMSKAEDATAEEWAAAETLARKVQAKAAEADRIAREEAERYGLKVVASDGRRGDINVVIVRVTKTRYVDADGRQWKRLRNKGVGVDGKQVGDFSRWDTRPWLRAATIDVIEAACDGADAFDFIKAGKQREIDAR